MIAAEVIVICKEHASKCGIDLSKFGKHTASPPGGQDTFWMVGASSEYSNYQCLFYPKRLGSDRFDLTLFG